MVDCSEVSTVTIISCLVPTKDVQEHYRGETHQKTKNMVK
jgi:hypothetical protein